MELTTITELLLNRHASPWRQVGTVSIYKFRLSIEPGQHQALRSILTPDELTRVDRFVTDELRRRALASRAATRLLLAQSTGIGPQSIEFRVGDHGKPFLASPDRPHFNLSHSRDLALLAISQSDEVGIDVEWRDDRPDFEAIAEHCFADSERLAMRILPPSKLRELFYEFWCCKEAYLKAVGTGISGGLKRCEVHRMEGDLAAIVNPTDPKESSRWRIHILDPEPEYAGAICLRC